MQTRHVVAIVIVIAVIVFALGATIGYSLSSGRTPTITQTEKNSTITQTASSFLTTTETTTIVEGIPNFLEYNFTGNGTINEDDLFAFLSNFTILYANTTHLQWDTNATVFNFNATSVTSNCSDVNYSLTFDCILVLNGFGAAYFGGGVQWANSTQWVGRFVINDTVPPRNVISYFSALESFLSIRGLILSGAYEMGSNVSCTETYYQGGVAEISVSIENSTTLTLTTIPTTLTRVDTFTTTTNTTQSIGFVTTYSGYEAPSTTVFEVCTYVG